MATHGLQNVIKIDFRYKIVSKISFGSYGAIYVADDLTNPQSPHVAVKFETGIFFYSSFDEIEHDHGSVYTRKRCHISIGLFQIRLDAFRAQYPNYSI